jgi:hypothetical protein
MKMIVVYVALPTNSASLKQFRNALEEVQRARRTSSNDRIYGDDVDNSAATGIRNAELTAIRPAAVAHGDNQLGSGCGIEGAFECSLHIPGYRAGDQEEVGMARRGNKMNAEPFNIVKTVIQRMHFQLTLFFIFF